MMALIPLPWRIAIYAGILSAVGLSGMWAGSNIEAGRSAKREEALKDEQIQTLKAKDIAYQQQVERSNQISEQFETRLSNIKVVNKTFTKEVRQEVEKQVYTDCQIPDSGIAILQKRFQGINMRLVGKSVKSATPAPLPVAVKPGVAK
jgi:hypothetical protein